MSDRYPSEAVRMVLQFMRLKHRLMIVLPEQLGQLSEDIPSLEAHRSRDYDLFLRISSALYENGELTMTQLSGALVVPPNTATRMVDWLVKDGYAVRLPDPEDRRVVLVKLTDSGRELYRAITDFLQQQVDRILSKLTSQEQATLISLLRKAMVSLREGHK